MPAARGLLLAHAATRARSTAATTERDGRDVGGDSEWQALRDAVQALGGGDAAGVGGDLGHPALSRSRREVLDLMARVDAGAAAAATAGTAGRDPLLFLAC